jgi:hypothetical protein
MAAQAAVWAQVRAGYQQGASLSELARSSGLSRTAIRTRARLEGWTKPETAQPSDPVSPGPLARVGTTSPLDSLPNERHALIRQHRREWRDLDRLGRESIRAASASHSSPADLSAKEANRMSTKEQQSHAKGLMGLFKAAVEGLTIKQEGERRAHGFDYKAQQEEKVDKGALDKQRLAALAINEFFDDFQRKHGEVLHENQGRATAIAPRC